ncbi:MAG: hypothetical protein GY920_12240 [Aliivibrio sp.]|nr:hypothetical protein [Aliivibrio sp.]
MKYFTVVFFAILGVIFATLPTYAQPSSLQANGDIPIDVDTLFESNKIEPFINAAYDNKAKAYGQFASVFNICQKQPNHEKCGKEYQQLELQYNVAKSNHEALMMVWTPEFRTLRLPIAAMPQLGKELTQLGYIAVRNQDLSDEDILVGLNGWLDAHDLANTVDIYLLHGFLVSTDAIVSKQ